MDTKAIFAIQFENFTILLLFGAKLVYENMRTFDVRQRSLKHHTILSIPAKLLSFFTKGFEHFLRLGHQTELERKGNKASQSFRNK